MMYTITSINYRGLDNYTHLFGLTESINVLPNVNSPINLHALVGVGDIIYFNDFNNQSFYTNLGIELSVGRLYCPIQFFIREEYYIIPNNINHNYLSAGFKFRLGKD